MNTRILALLTLLGVALLTTAATKKMSEITTTTTIAGNDRLLLSVADTNTPTGFKTRTIAFAKFAEALSNAVPESVTFTNNNYTTNITYNISTNMAAAIDSNTGTFYAGETNNKVGLQAFRGDGGIQSILSTNNGWDFYVGTNTLAARMGRTGNTNWLTTAFQESARFYDDVIVANSETEPFVRFGSASDSPVLKWETTVGDNEGFCLTNSSAGVTADLKVKNLYADGPVQVQQAAAIYSGTGAPSFAAPKGSLYLRINGGNANQVLYINTNSLASGWFAK